MRRSLKAFPTRAAAKARETAAGSPVPAGQETPRPDAATRPGARERAAMRRRARKITRLREAQVRELGMLTLEMERLGRRNDELLSRRAREIEELDREQRHLLNALGGRKTLTQVVAAGIAGSCPACGTLMGTEDRFCSHCGRAAGDESPLPPPRAAASSAQLQLETVGAERR